MFPTSGIPFERSGRVFPSPGTPFEGSGKVFPRPGRLFEAPRQVFEGAGTVFVAAGRVFEPPGAVFEGSGRGFGHAKGPPGGAGLGLFYLDKFLKSVIKTLEQAGKVASRFNGKSPVIPADLLSTSAIYAGS
ncbi:hypothetical protein GCM10027345_13570 [Hymenobacter daeguensis]